MRNPSSAGGRPSRSERYGQRRDADAAADEQRPLDREVVPLPERPRHGDLVPAARAPRSRASRGRSGRRGSRARPDGARQRLKGRGSSRPGASSMKNCPGSPGSSPPRARRTSAYGPIASFATTRRRSRRIAQPACGQGTQALSTEGRRLGVERCGRRTELVFKQHKRCHAPTPIRSWSDSVASARALAIACTAAAAPEIVVMHGTRATSAASRIR